MQRLVAVVLTAASIMFGCRSDGSDDSSEAFMVIQVDGAPRSGLVVIDADGEEIGRPTSTLSTGDQTNPDVSRDGRRIAFGAADADGHDDLWVVDIDGSNARIAFDCDDPCLYIDDPAWSVDDERIAVCTLTARDDGDVGALAAVDVESGRLDEIIVFPAGEFCAGARWSPDGADIVVELVSRGAAPAGDEIMGTALVIVDTESGLASAELTDWSAFAGTPDWSRSGEIVFAAVASRDAPGSDVFVIRPDGSGQRQLTELAATGGSAREPTVSVDGGAVYFVAEGRVDGLARLDVETGVVRQAFPVSVAAHHPRLVQ